MSDNRLGPWEVTGELARGGQGAVLRGRHAETGVPAAIKVLLRADPRSVRRFKLEAAVLTRLAHPNLVRVLDHGERDGAPYLAMELVEGQSLSALLAERGPPAWGWTARTLAAVARALQACHDQGVIHRDLKPENVIIERGTGRPVLVDFGLVRRDREVFGDLSIDAHSRLSQTGELRGTPSYMSPEQVSPGKWGELGPWTDVYALGATLHVMLTGEPPYRADSLPGLIYAILDTPPPDPRATDRRVPEVLARLCMQAMSKASAERPPSAEAFAQALEATRPPAPAGRRGRFIALVALGALLPLVVIVATFAFLTPPRGDPGPGPAPSAAVMPPPPPPPAAPRLPAPALAIERSKGGLLRLQRVHGAYEDRHVDSVWAIAVSPDQRRVLSGTGFWNHEHPGTLHLRDLGATEERLAWTGHTSSVTGVAFTRDARRGLSGGRDGAVHLWDLERARPALATLRGAGVVTLEPLPGREDTYLVARLSGEVTVLTVTGDTLVAAATWRVPGAVSRALALLDGRSAFVDGDRPVVLDLEKGSARVLHDRHLNLAAATVSPDGERVLAGSHSRDVYVFDLRAGTLDTFKLEHGRKVFSAAYLADSRRVLVGRFDGRLAIFDPATREDVRVFDQLPTLWGVAAVALLRDGRRSVVGAGDGRLRLFDIDADRDLSQPAAPHALPARVESLAVDADGARALVGCFDPGAGRGTAHVLDLRTGARRPLATGREWAKGVGLDASGHALVACGRPDPRVQWWDLATGTHLDLTADFGDAVLTTAALSPDARWVVAGSDDGHARAWRLDQDPPRHLDLERLPSTTANDSAFSPDGRVAVMVHARHGGEARSTLASWDLEGGANGKLPLDLSATVVAVFPGATDVLVGGARGELQRRSLRDGSLVLDLPRHGGTLLDVALSPDGSRVASAAMDGLVRLSDTRSGATLDALDLGLTADRAEALAFLPGGRTLLVGTARGVVLELAVGQEH